VRSQVYAASVGRWQFSGTGGKEGWVRGPYVPRGGGPCSVMPAIPMRALTQEMEVSSGGSLFGPPPYRPQSPPGHLPPILDISFYIIRHFLFLRYIFSLDAVISLLLSVISLPLTSPYLGHLLTSDMYIRTARPD